MHTMHLYRLVLAAGLVDAILEANARMKLEEEGCLESTRAAIGKILPEDRIQVDCEQETKWIVTRGTRQHEDHITSRSDSVIHCASISHLRVHERNQGVVRIRSFGVRSHCTTKLRHGSTALFIVLNDIR